MNKIIIVLAIVYSGFNQWLMYMYDVENDKLHELVDLLLNVCILN